MKQLIEIAASDTVQVIVGHSEVHDVQGTWSSKSAEWLWNNLFSNTICGIGWLSIICAMLGIIIFVALFKPRFKLWLFHHLKVSAFFIWILGIIIYMIGFNEHGSAESNIALVLRSCLSSMEMFVSHSDLLEVSNELHDNATYMGLFSLIHFCAVGISAIFILRLFGFKIVSWARIVWSYLWSWLPFKRSYYVMFGVNANTVTLAQTIPQKEKHCVIFINLPDKEHSHTSLRFSFSHFFHSDSNGVDKYIEDIEKMGALLFNSSRSLDNPNLDFTNNNGGKDKDSDVFKIFKALEFSSIVRVPLQKLLRKVAMRGNDNQEEGKVEFFFLSDNEKENLVAISLLRKLQDKPLNESSCKFSCYCHSRKNSDNSALLNEGTLAFTVHIIDTSNLAVLNIKKNPKYQPVNYVEKGEIPGTVSSAFVGMIIGFGETGRDAFRFLYEFSSFTKDDEGNPSAKTIHVIDKDIDELKADFLIEVPALRDKPEIKWWKMKSTHSEGFWERMKGVIQELNYVVVAVGDDDEAASIATSIFEFAYRYRKNLEKFNIFVRLRKSIREDFLQTHKEYFNVIIPFGSIKSAFKYEVISNDVLEKHAKCFYYRYENKGACPEGKEASKLWMMRRHKYLDEKNPYDRKEKEIEVWYKEEQDRSNAYHIFTKVALSPKGTTASMLDSNKQLLKNLSNCEHLRWNAKMELLGFEPATEDDIQKAKANKEPPTWKSFRHRRHESIVDCKTLHSDSRLKDTIFYDENAVKLSFEIDEEERKNNVP